MIVSHKMASEAATTMGFLSLDGLDEERVQKAYRNWAKLLHPDKPSGDTAKFVNIDRAKCILLGWLEKRAKEEPSDGAVSSTTCPMCGGSGRRTLRRGFRSMTMICGTCRGHGELVPNEKVEE